MQHDHPVTAPRAKALTLDPEATPTAGAPLTFSFQVDLAPERAFAAINDVRAWWAGAIDGSADALGATFTYRYGDLHRSTQRVVEYVPGKKIAWRVTDSHLAFVEHKDEWTGTTIVFELAQKGGSTEVRFTHVGLGPEVACYGRCSGAWNFYVTENLRKFLETGVPTAGAAPQ